MGDLQTNSCPSLAGSCSPSINLLHFCIALHTSTAWGSGFPLPLEWDPDSLPCPLCLVQHGPCPPLPLSHSTPASLSSWGLFQLWMLSPASGPLHLPSPLPEMFFPQFISWLLPFPLSSLSPQTSPYQRSSLGTTPAIILFHRNHHLCSIFGYLSPTFTTRMWVCVDRTQACLVDDCVPGTTTCSFLMPIKDFWNESVVSLTWPMWLPCYVSSVHKLSGSSSSK